MPRSVKKKKRLSMKETRKSKRLCAHCSKPALPDKVNCESCRTKYNSVSKQRARTWKFLGLCMKCGGPDIVKGITVCQRCRLAIRWAGLRRKGIPESEIEKAKQAMLVFDGICQGCGNTNPKCRGSVDWGFDHDHPTLEFRGILGTGCNSALGFAGDSSAVLVRLSEYLERRGR